MSNFDDDLEPGEKELPPGGSQPASADGILKGMAILRTLASLDFYRHFVERLLSRIGKVLRLPWWAVNLVFYAVTAVAVTTLARESLIYYGGHIGLYGQLAAEFAFVTWMLCHVRQSRSQALIVAARLSSGKDRRRWLRQYFGPLHWGWAWSWRAGREQQGHRFIRLRLGPATLLVVAAYYGLVIWRWGLVRAWEILPSELLLLYTHSIKAAMLVAVLGHFWWLSGLMRVADGDLASSLTRNARIVLRSDCRRAVLRLDLFVGATAGAWIVFHGWGLFWSYVLSAWMAVLLVTQWTIIAGFRLRESGSFFPKIEEMKRALRFALRTVEEFIRFLAFVPEQSRVGFSRREAWAATLVIACPTLLGWATALAGKLWAG